MRSAIVAVTCLLAATACNKTLTLPDDPVERAATCSVVAAVQARAATQDVKAPLPFEAQGRILHYAILAGAEGGSFSTERAAAVNARIPALQDKIIDGKWQPLVPACAAAFPAAATTAVKLPASPFEARLGCDALGDFITRAMAKEDVAYGDELLEYENLGRKLDQSSMVTSLRSRAGSNIEEQQEERKKALAKIAQAGSPMLVMKQCIARFG